MTRRQGLVAAAVAVAVVAVPLVLALVTGAIDAAHQDEWGYYRPASILRESGELYLVNWNAMTLIGQLLWAQPFLAVLGDSIASAHVAGAVAAVIALAAAYWLYRRFLPHGLALFGMVAAGTVPVFLLGAPTFMTDITALAPQLVCLALGLASLDAARPARYWLLGAALVVGAFGFTIREVGLAAPLAVLAGYAVAARQRGESVRPVLGLAAVFLVACVAFYGWRAGLAGAGRRPVNPAAASSTARVLTALFFVLALSLLPALALAPRRLLAPLRSRAGAVIVAVLALVAAVTLLDGRADQGLFPGNYLTQRGVNEGLYGAGPPVFPDPVWWGVIGLTFACALALGGFLYSSGRDALCVARTEGLLSFEPRVWTLALFGVLAAAAVFLFSATGEALVFDRYVLPLVVLLTLAILYRARRDVRLPSVRARGAVALAASALLALMLLLEMKPTEAARWEAGEQLVAGGIPAGEVDAGFEWVGFHYGHRRVQQGRRVWRPPEPGYMAIFPLARNCGLVSNVPLREAWLEPLGVKRYSTMLGLREHRLWLYRNTRSCRRGA